MSAPRKSNPFEANARAAKVAALTATLDEAFRQSGIDPNGAEALAGVERLDADGWTAAASVSRVRMPSATTIAWIVDGYRIRVAALDGAANEAPGLEVVPF